MQLFIFNPDLGGEADAEKKLLFFYPPETPLAEQVSSVGLCEAIASFSATFTDEDYQSLHTQNGRLISLQAEPKFSIVLCMPHIPEKGAAAKSGASSPSSPAAASTRSGSKDAGTEEAIPPSEEAVQDCSLLALLRRIYGMLRLACGTLAEIAAARGADGMRAFLGDVLPLLLRVCVPAGEEDARRLDLLDTIEGMKFLVVGRPLYLRVQYLLNLVMTSHQCVRHAMLLHGDQLVWSSLSRDATQQVHRAVSHVVAPSLQIPTRSLQPFHPSRSASLPDEALLFAIGLVQRQLRSVAKPPPAAGGFVCGAGDVTQDALSAVRVPCIHIETQPGDAAGGGASGDAPPESAGSGAGGGLTRLRLVVFQLQQAAVALLIDEASPNWSQPLWYQQLASQLVPEMQPLPALLAQEYAKNSGADDAHRVIYFNRLNNVLRSSIRNMRAGLTGRLGLHTEPKHLLNRLHADLTEGEHGVREVALQTAGAHGWLVGQANGSRGFYLLLDGLDCSWSEVQQEVNNLCSTRFANIFLE